MPRIFDNVDLNLLPASKPILEINPRHPLLSEGEQLEDPAGFVKRLNQLLVEIAGGGSRIILP